MKRLLACASAAVLMVALGSAGTLATPKVTSLWSVYNINSGGSAYTPKAAPGTSTSAANFDFPSSPTTALLTTTKDKALLGDLTGKTLTANFTVTAIAGAAFNHAATPCDPGTPASVRLYFAGDTTGKFTRDTAGYSRYWWSNPDSYALAGGPFTLTVPLTVGHWSNWGGQLSSDHPAEFANAVTQVSAIGLSFGGGCFFANGVGVSPGNASFTLSSYSVAP